MHAPTYDGMRFANPLKGYFTSSDTLRSGYVMQLAYNSSGLTSDVTELTGTLGASAAAIEAARQGRMKLWQKPTLAGILAGAPIALVVNAPPAGIVGNGVKTNVELIPLGPVGPEYFDVAAYTDENCAVGDILGVIPESYYLGRAVIPGAACFRVAVAANRSATPGLVRGIFKHYDITQMLDKFTGFDDRFTGHIPLTIAGFTPAEIALGGYDLSGTSAAAAYTSDHPGRLAITPNTTNIAQIRRGTASFPFLLGAGVSAFFHARVNWGVGGVDNDAFCGLSITGATIADGSVPALDDYIGFYLQGDADASINIATNKDNGTDNVNDTGVDATADTMMDVAFLVRNRLAGTTAGYKTIHAWVNGALTNSLTTAAVAALINDDENMGFAFAGIGGAAARVIEIERARCWANIT